MIWVVFVFLIIETQSFCTISNCCMSKSRYKFNIIITEEQVELMIAMFNEQRNDCKCELEVYAAICEILYVYGFRAYPDGMHNRETDCHYNWDRLITFETVVDFQIDYLIHNK